MKMRSYSIRSLLILTLLVAVSIAIPIRRAENQRIGRQWVDSQRGHVFFEHEILDESSPHSVPHVPQFLIRVLGIDFFNPARCVVFDCDPLVDLKPISKMTTLQTIVINIEMADDIEFAPLEQLPNLEEVHFTEWSSVSSEQLVRLRSRMPNVKFISETHWNGG